MPEGWGELIAVIYNHKTKKFREENAITAGFKMNLYDEEITAYYYKETPDGF